MKKVFVAGLILLSFPCAHALCVKAKEVNLRAGPGVKFKKTWTVGRYTPLIKLEKKGNWVRVQDQDGVKHWVLRSLVTNQFQCLAVKVNRANLRQGPGKNQPLAEFRFADRYTPFKRVDFKGDWYRVVDAYGQYFWVYRSSVWRPVTVNSMSF